jgi:uncharacterized LabA/DUF88 family protein
MTTSYLFVDGNYLQQRLDGREFTKVFYYDALPVKAQNETEDAFEARLKEKHDFFNYLRSLDGWHVHEGISKRSRGERARQKEVDILIAVDMLTHTHRKNMDRLAFIAGDQDFRPLLDAVVRDGMYVTLLYGPSSVSIELKNTADAAIPLDFFTMHSFMEHSVQEAYPSPEILNAYSIPHHPSNDVLKQEGFKGGEVVARLWENESSVLIYATVKADEYVFPGMGMPASDANCSFLKRVYDAYYGPIEWQAV